MTDATRAELTAGIRDFAPIAKLASERIQKAQNDLSSCMDLDELRKLQGQIEEARYWQKLGTLVHG